MKKGFTLIETIVYLAIVTGILIATISFAWEIIYGNEKFVALQEVNQNSQYVLEQLRQKIRESSDITSLSSSTLVLDNSPNDDYTFYIDPIDKKVTLQIGSGTPIDLTTPDVEVTGGFEDLSTSRSKNVKIDIVISYKNPENLQRLEADFNLVTAIELRRQ